MNDNEREVDGGHAVVDVLLHERLGGEVAPDLTAVVLARAARGDGAGAAAKLATAERAGTGAMVRGRWLAAALVLLGLGVVVAVALSQRERHSDALAPVQQPQEPPPGQGQEPEVVQVQSLEQLKELLAQTVGMTIEMWQLPFEDLDLPVRMQPHRLSPAAARLFAAAITKDLRAEPATGWKWTNRFRFLLRDGRAIELAFAWGDDALERTKRMRIGVRGLQGDASVVQIDKALDKQDSRVIEEAWVGAMRAAQVSNGLMVGSKDLSAERIAAFRDCESLTLRPAWIFDFLAGISSRDLIQLAALPKLRRLDVSRLTKVIDDDALLHIAKVAQLEELILDGCSVDDEALLPIGQMPNLKALSLRRCANVRGSFFSTGLLGPKHPARPFQALLRLDLSDCTQLQDLALPDLGALPKLQELRMVSTPLPSDDKRWQIFKLATRVEVLDLSGHPFAAERLHDLAGIASLRELLLCNCDLDDEDLQILLGAKTLQRLCIGDNPVREKQGGLDDTELAVVLRALLRSTALRELDLRPHAALSGKPQVVWPAGVSRVIVR